MKKTRNIVKEIITHELGIEINDNLNLFDSGLDSLGTLRVLTFIEDELKIEIPDEELIPKNFETIEALVSMVNKYV